MLACGARGGNAEGLFCLRGSKLVRVDGAGIAQVFAPFACIDVGEDAGLGKVVGGSGWATISVVFQIGAIQEVCGREFFELGHRCWDSTLGVDEGKFWGGQAGLFKRCVRIDKSYLPGMSDRGADRRILRQLAWNCDNLISADTFLRTLT